MPAWVLPGLLMRETNSFYRDGRIVYVNRAPGADGELGCFQVTMDAFEDVARRGERFCWLRDRPAFCETIAIRILQRSYARSGSWETAVRRYHRGAGGASSSEAWRYLTQVRTFGIAYLTPSTEE